MTRKTATTEPAAGLAAEIAALRDLKTDDLAARYRELHGHPPRIRHREWMWKRICFAVQERRYGGLSGKARKALEGLIAELDLPADERTRTTTGEVRPRKTPGGLAPGTVLTRRWRGRDLQATIRADGVEVDGEVHRSFTAAAKAVTGSHWNGPFFWGVTRGKSR